MSVAVVQRHSPHMPRSASRTHSPMDSKRSLVKPEDKSKKDLSLQSNNLDSKLSPRSNPPPASKQLPDTDEGTANKVASHADTTQPLAPPPRPAPSQQNPTDTPDYFSSDHNPSHFSLEPNPFEQSFGNPSTEGPGKSLLPPVAAITSPAPLNGGAASAGGYNWTNSLRSGPLSPAMLNEPTGSGGYFDSHLRGGFPTPNESSLRTGLTPGGGGSMFPAPSPNSQALYQQLASGGATPSTLDFHRTAMTAAAARKPGNLNNMTSQPQEKRAPVAPMDHTSQQQTQQQPFGQHDNDAANGLFLLAQAGNGTQSNNQFAIPNPPEMSHGLPDAMQGRAQEASPNFAKRATRNANGSMGGSMSGSARDMSEMSGDMSEIGEQIKPNTRAKGKRSSSGKGVGATNGRRKAEEPPSKQSSAKRAKTSKASAEMDMSMGMDGMDSEEEPNIKEEQYHENGKKMTDEEKRKNFLERNRVAALKCRQRKKQWLANLQAKVEIFSSENDTLSAQVTQLREEIVNLKTILLAHKDCPVSQGQGLGSYFQSAQEYNPHANPYGMAMPNGQQVMAGQRRYS